MEKNDLIDLINLRQYLIEEYKFLEGKNEPSSLVRARDTAIILDKAIRKIDKILKDKVTYKGVAE